MELWKKCAYPHGKQFLLIRNKTYHNGKYRSNTEKLQKTIVIKYKYCLHTKHMDVQSRWIRKNSYAYINNWSLVRSSFNWIYEAAGTTLWSNTRAYRNHTMPSSWNHLLNKIGHFYQTMLYKIDVLSEEQIHYIHSESSCTFSWHFQTSVNIYK